MPKRTDLKTKKAIVAEHLQGVPFSQLAKKYEVSPGFVALTWRQYKLNAGKDAIEPEELVDRLKEKSYIAVESALDCNEDPYKRGNIGIKVLQGTGEFQSGDQVNVQINTLVQQLPQEWKGRYLSNDDEDVIELENE